MVYYNMVWKKNTHKDIEKIEYEGKEIIHRKQYKQKKSIKKIIEPGEEI